MKNKGRVVVGALVLAGIAIGATVFVRSTHQSSQSKQSANSAPMTDSSVLSLPDGLSPTEVFTTTSAAFVIKAAADADFRSLYSWEPGNSPRLIIKGRDLDVARLSDDIFVAWYGQSNEESVVTLSTQKLISEPMPLPNGGPSGWWGCEGDTRYIACIGNRPGMSADDKDYDEMGFSAVLVVDPQLRKSSWFQVGDQNYFRFYSQLRKIYVGNLVSPSPSSPVKIFDMDGKIQGTTQFVNAALSRSGRFADSFQEDGSEFWAIYDVKYRKALLSFNCDKITCKVGDRDEGHEWNPIYEGQIVALRGGGAYGAGGTCDIYQAAPPRLIKTVPCEGLPVYDWTRDGRELVTIAYEGGKFSRQPVN